jgi:hypothetical protein
MLSVDFAQRVVGVAEVVDDVGLGTAVGLVS